MILVDAEGIGAWRPDRALFADLSVTISSGDRLGVVGINGTGKSTLLRVLAGVGEPEAGVVRFGRDVRVGLLDQTSALSPGTVRAAVGEGWEAAAILSRLGMADLGDVDVDRISGGQARRVALAGALVGERDLLVLDEPTNHLDLGAIAWLEEHLAAFKGGLVLVTHDRHVLDRVTTRVLELDRGRAYVHEGGYRSWLEARAEREARVAAAEERRRNLARAELAWLRRGAPARTRKSKARLASAGAVVEGRPEAPARRGELTLGSSAPVRLGSKGIELAGVGDAFGEHWLFRGLDLSLDPGDRLGVVGANGTGKSTLLDVIAGTRTPREGGRGVGTTVQIGYYDQLGAALDPALTVRQAIAGPHRRADPSDAALAERFWFDADAQHAPISTLSGGERRRLQLVLVLAAKPNVLLLDEPTNDLDLDTLRAFESYLEEFAGIVVAVSHDRSFLERCTDEVLVLDGAGGSPRRATVRAYVARVAAGSATEARPSRATSTRSSRASAPVAPDAKASPAARARTAPFPTSGATTPRRRTRSTLERIVARTERRVEALGRDRLALTAAIQDAAQRADHAELASLTQRLAALEAELGAAEAEWLDASGELDSISAAPS